MNATGLLAGRHIVVTGAGMGLGAAYAEAAAAEGAQVVVNDLNAEHAHETAVRIRAAGGVVAAYVADVSDWNAAGELIEFCVAQFGGIDGLVNNAGILGKVGSMLTDDPEVAARVLNVNVLGTIYPSMHAARTMQQAGTPGAIVNVSSGNQCGHPLLATYGASKGAVSTLTFAWAEALSEYGIRVNAISPNAHTNMVDEGVRQLGYNAEARDYPTPADNAAAVVYLLSELSAHLTGQVVRVDHEMLAVTSHPLVVSPRVPIKYSVAAVADAFDGPLRAAIQPPGISYASVTHLEQI